MTGYSEVGLVGVKFRGGRCADYRRRSLRKLAIMSHNAQRPKIAESGLRAAEVRVGDNPLMWSPEAPTTMPSKRRDKMHVLCRPGYLKSCDEAAPALRLIASIFRACT